LQGFFQWAIFEFGPCWYILWLLLLSAAHCLEGGAPVVVPRPSLAKAVGVGLFLALPQAYVTWLSPGGNLLAMPLGQSSLVFYIAFFCAGVVARRSNWLDEPLGVGEARAARALSALLAVGSLAAFVVLYVLFSGPYAHNPPVLVNGTYFMVDGALASPLTYGLPFGGDINGVPRGFSAGPSFAYSLVLCALMGPACMVFSFAAFDIFRTRLNFETRATKMLAAAAYTAYLIHPWVVVPLTLAYVAVLGAAGVHIGVDVAILTQRGFSSPIDAGDGYIWLGWAAVGILSQLVVWPLAHCVRQLPGLRSIL
jgi:hypothetical protein